MFSSFSDSNVSDQPGFSFCVCVDKREGMKTLKLTMDGNNDNSNCIRRQAVLVFHSFHLFYFDVVWCCPVSSLFFAGHLRFSTTSRKMPNWLVNKLLLEDVRRRFEVLPLQLKHPNRR